MNITAKELSGEHIGKTVTFPFDMQHVTGELVDLHHQVDLIADYPLCSPVKYTRGQQSVSIEIAGNFEDGETLTTRLQPRTPVTIQEDQ